MIQDYRKKVTGSLPGVTTLQCASFSHYVTACKTDTEQPSQVLPKFLIERIKIFIYEDVKYS